MNAIKSILKTPLFKITSLNSVSVLLKIGIGLVTSKVIAVFVGPGGMALVGNLRNFMSALETISTLGFQNGIVKYVAEIHSDSEKLKKFLSTVFISLAVVALVLSSILFLLADFFSATIFGNEFEYANVFRILAAALPWYAASIVLTAVVNGLGKFREVIYTGILGNVIGLVFSVILIWNFHTLGALLSIIVAPSLVFFISAYYLNKEIRFLEHLSFQWFSNDVLQKMSSYSLMALVSSVLSPLVYLAVRNDVIQRLGIEQAGYWEAVMRISTYYLLFISTLLVVYFLPKLVVAKDNQETKLVIKSYYKNIIPLFSLALFVLFLAKDIVIHVLFTKTFLPVRELFFWQLLGDVFKACSLILGYNLVAKKKTGFYIFTEFLSMFVLFFSSHFLVAVFEIEGVVMAYCVTYFVYLSALLLYFRKSVF